MARVRSGIKALFNSTKIKKVLEDQIKEIERKTVSALAYIGEQFVDEARLNGNYKNQTGNLRASIGYIILRDGKIMKQYFPAKGKGKEGVKRGKEFAEELAQKFPDGYVLIGVAGMKYAAALEAMSYDVITGSAPTEELVKQLFYEINN